MTSQTARPRAYSYVRFSTAEQGKGDSLRRQTEKAKAYAAKRGLILDDKLNMKDLGRSAFRGANVTMGALGDFLSLVQSGDIPAGSFLLAENIDRISRDVITEAMATLTMLINSGITLVTLGDEREWSREIINKSPYAIMELIMGFIRANDESARKQELLRAAWHGKRLKLKEQGKTMTRLCPGWLRLREDRSGFDLIPDRAATVARVFHMTLAGKGQNAIAETFNREGVPVFGRGQMWHKTYVAKMLSDRSIIGIYTPHRVEWLKGKKLRIPTEPVEGYFPAVIDHETFEQVQGIKGRGSGGSGTTNGNGLGNILASLAKCPKCGSTMTRVNKGGKKGGKPYLVCIKAKTGDGCDYKAVRCHEIEYAIVEKAEEFAITMPSPDEKLEAEWQRLLNEEGGHDEAISNTIDAIKAAGHSPALISTLQQLEADREEIRRQLVEVGERVTASLTNRTQNTVVKLVEGLEAEPRDVPEINATMRQLFEKVTVDWPSGYLRFHWKHAPGETTEFMLSGEMRN